MSDCWTAHNPSFQSFVARNIAYKRAAATNNHVAEKRIRFSLSDIVSCKRTKLPCSRRESLAPNLPFHQIGNLTNFFRRTLPQWAGILKIGAEAVAGIAIGAGVEWSLETLAEEYGWFDDPPVSRVKITGPGTDDLLEMHVEIGHVLEDTSVPLEFTGSVENSVGGNDHKLWEYEVILNYVSFGFLDDEMQVTVKARHVWAKHPGIDNSEAPWISFTQTLKSSDANTDAEPNEWPYAFPLDITGDTGCKEHPHKSDYEGSIEPHKDCPVDGSIKMYVFHDTASRDISRVEMTLKIEHTGDTCTGCGK